MAALHPFDKSLLTAKRRWACFDHFRVSFDHLNSVRPRLTGKRRWRRAACREHGRHHTTAPRLTLSDLFRPLLATLDQFWTFFDHFGPLWTTFDRQSTLEACGISGMAPDRVIRPLEKSAGTSPVFDPSWSNLFLTAQIASGQIFFGAGLCHPAPREERRHVHCI